MAAAAAVAGEEGAVESWAGIGMVEVAWVVGLVAKNALEAALKVALKAALKEAVHSVCLKAVPAWEVDPAANRVVLAGRPVGPSPAAYPVHPAVHPGPVAYRKALRSPDPSHCRGQNSSYTQYQSPSHHLSRALASRLLCPDPLEVVED